MPLGFLAIALVLTALTTGVQVAWTDLALSSGVGATTRFASNVSYTGSSARSQKSTADQVMQWAADVASEAHVQPDDVTIVARHLPSGAVIPLDQLVVGDEVTLTVEKTVSNPLLRGATVVANALTHAAGAGDALHPEGITVRATATNRVG